MNSLIKNFDESDHKNNDNVLRLVLNDDKNKKKYHPVVFVRKILLFSLMLLSISWYFYDHFMNDKDAVIVKNKPISIDSILLENYLDKTANDSAIKDIPLEVISFIDGNRIETMSKESKVVIYEIVDPKKDQKIIDQLLVDADKLLSSDKLTSPAGNNALDKYAKVLTIDNSNEIAKKGIQKIYERYEFFLKKVVSKNEGYKVTGILNSVVKLTPYGMDVNSLIDQYKNYIDEDSFVNLNAASVVEDSSRNQDESMKESVVKKTIGDIDKEIAYAASRLIEENDFKTAEKILKEFVESSKYHGLSSDVLLQLYLTNQKYSEAELLIYSNSDADIHIMAENVARILTARNDIEGALSILSNHVPRFDEYKSFYYLKAGLYYKLGDFEESSLIYRKLLEHDHINGRYWLGLAVSTESESSDIALQAFAYANNYSPSGSRVKRYIDQRVLVLPQK